MTLPSYAEAADIRRRRIRELNDTFRENPFVGGNRFLVTQGIVGLTDAERREVIDRMRAFAAFTDANAPYGEHDFGSFDHNGQAIFWKIDYYSADDKERRSRDPADPEVTCRVLTLMLGSEY